MAVKKKSRFGLFLLLYALVLALIAAAALFVFHAFLREYEAARPARALEAYAQTLQSGPTEAVRAALAPLDTTLESEEEALAFLAPLLKDARFKEDVALRGEHTRVYRVLVEGGECGRVSIREGEPARFGFAPWSVEAESYDWSARFHTLRLTVPEEYRVCYGVQTLGEDHVTARGRPYAALAECYERYEGLPTLTAYETGPLIGDGQLQVYDRDGQRIEPEQLDEERYLDNCSEEMKERLRDFADAFLPAYVEYTVYTIGYGRLQPMVVRNSALDQRLRQTSNERMSYATRCELLGSEIRHMVDLGQGRRLLDLHYETRIKGQGNEAVTAYSIRVILIEDGGQLQAETLYNY